MYRYASCYMICEYFSCVASCLVNAILAFTTWYIVMRVDIWYASDF